MYQCQSVARWTTKILAATQSERPIVCANSGRKSAIRSRQKAPQVTCTCPRIKSRQSDLTNYFACEGVVAKYAVEALQGARKYLKSTPPSPEARIFIERNVVDMMKILLNHQQSKVGPAERKVVETSCCIVLQIVRDDLERAVIVQQDHGVSFPFNSSLKALEWIFYNGNKYFTGNPFFPNKVRRQMIMTFRRIGGLSLLSSYMNDRIGTASFPDIRVLRSIVSAALEVLPAAGESLLHTNAKEQQVAEQNRQRNNTLSQIKEVQGIALATTQHLLVIEEGILKEAPLACVGQIIHASKAIYTQIEILQFKLTLTNDVLACTTEKFVVFWRAFCLRLVRSASFSLEFFGWSQIADLVDKSNRLRPPPQGYLVSGAGTAFINGSYMFDPQCAAKIRNVKGSNLSYVRNVPSKDREGAGKKITLFSRCSMRSQQEWWFLSEVDEEKPGTDKGIDYYRKKSKHNEDFPPLSGWIVLRRSGSEPAPTLEPIGGPAFLAEPEHHLMEWVEENALIEHAGEVELTSKVARSVMRLYNFVATSRDDSQPKRGNLTHGHIESVLSICQKSTDLVALADLYLQFIKIRPSLPSDLQTVVDQGIQFILGKASLSWLLTKTNICGCRASN